MLMTAAEVFDEMHGRVFSALEAAAAGQPSGGPGVSSSSSGGSGTSWDVRDVLGARRQQVLAGAVIAFSRVIPLEMAPASHPLWRLAEEYGARCTTSLTPEVTHVVAMSRATEKVPPDPPPRPGRLRLAVAVGPCGLERSNLTARQWCLGPQPTAAPLLLHRRCSRPRSSRSLSSRLPGRHALCAAMGGHRQLPAAACRVSWHDCRPVFPPPGLSLHQPSHGPSSAPASAALPCRLECCCILWRRANELRFPVPV
jgi:hypothetical protein